MGIFGRGKAEVKSVAVEMYDARSGVFIAGSNVAIKGNETAAQAIARANAEVPTRLFKPATTGNMRGIARH